MNPSPGDFLLIPPGYRENGAQMKAALGETDPLDLGELRQALPVVVGGYKPQQDDYNGGGPSKKPMATITVEFSGGKQAAAVEETRADDTPMEGVEQQTRGGGLPQISVSYFSGDSLKPANYIAKLPLKVKSSSSATLMVPESRPCYLQQELLTTQKNQKQSSVARPSLKESAFPRGKLE